MSPETPSGWSPSPAMWPGSPDIVPQAPTTGTPLTSRPRVPDAGTWKSAGYRSAGTRSKVAVVAHAVAGLAVIGQAVVLARVFDLLDRGERFELTEAEVDRWIGQVEDVGGVIGLTALVAFVSLVTWLSRSVDNTPPLGGGVARRGPRWAIGAWFIPIVNVVMPALILRDLARRIHPELGGRSWLVLAWWLTYWGPTIVSIYVQLLPIRGTDSIRDLYTGLVAVALITAVGYFVTLYVVHRLQRDADLWATRRHLLQPPFQSAPSEYRWTATD